MIHRPVAVMVRKLSFIVTTGGFWAHSEAVPDSTSGLAHFDACEKV